MTYDQPEGDVPGNRAAQGVRAFALGVGILAALGLVVIMVLIIGVMWQEHDFRQTAQRNEAAATSKASAAAQAFDQELIESARSAAPTSSQVRALGARYGVRAGSPVVEGGSVVVTFRVEKVYWEPSYFGGDNGTVELCYRAAVPIAPATSPVATLQPVNCAEPGTDR